METLHAIGAGLLVFKVLVGLDAVTGAMLTNCVCFIPSVLTLLSRKPSKITAILVLIDLGCIAAQSSGFWAWPIFVPELSHHAWAVPMAIFLCSLGWWENFVSKDSIFPCIQALASLSENLKQVRSKTFIILAPWKCLVYFCCLFTFISMRMSVQELLEPNPFDAKEIKVVIRKGQGQLNPELFEQPFDGQENKYGPITTPRPEVIDIEELLQAS